jgi:hypothetical protein
MLRARVASRAHSTVVTLEPNSEAIAVPHEPAPTITTVSAGTDAEPTACPVR